LDNSKISQYILDYLSFFDVKYFLNEEKYVDKDYMIDFSKFYARSFETNDKFTKRIHFFNGNISEDDFCQLLTKYDEKLRNKVNDSYLGFSVVKPIENPNGEFLIGRTLLKPYDNKIKDHPTERRILIKPKASATLYGIYFEFESLPFQTQDKAVGACATTACWISLNQLSSLFGIPKSSLIEITERSISFPSESRNFPSMGLNYLQIKNYYNSLGLDTEFIDPNVFTNIPRIRGLINDVTADVVKAYIKEMNLPILTGLVIKLKSGSELYHAVIIAGYRHDKGQVNKIYVHDDQIGPYGRVTPISNLLKWQCNWLNVPNLDVDSINVDKLIIPLYPKIRLSFRNMYLVYLLNYKEKLQDKIKADNLNPDSRYELFLTDVKKYKRYLLENQFENKSEKLRRPFPRFLWVVRLMCDSLVYYDYVFDATSVLAKEPYENITYSNK
jgi:hypothetical protein